MVDQPTLVKAMGNKYISDEEVAAYNLAMIRADVTTPLRAAMFAAQLGHESLGMSTYEEFASGDAYEGRQDLGNIQVGDGRRYKGRGPIQITGRRNYTEFSKWAFANGHSATPDEFVRFPERLAQVDEGLLGAAWYWSTQRPLNELSDRRDIEGATRAINGGLTNIEDRRARYARCRVLGDALLPTDQGDIMANEAQDIQRELRGPEGRGWDVVVYDKPGQKRTLVAMVGEVFTKVVSQLPVPLTGKDVRPRPLDQPDDLFGHVLSLRAEVAALTKLVKESGK